MIRLLLYAALILLAAPSGIVAARLLWRWGDHKLKVMEDARVEKLLNK